MYVCFVTFEKKGIGLKVVLLKVEPIFIGFEPPEDENR